VGNGRVSMSVRKVALAALVLLVGGGAVAEGKEQAATGATKAPAAVTVRLELFEVGLVDDDRLTFRRREMPLDARGPDAAVAALQRGRGGVTSFFDGAPAIVHSTSWRFEKEGVVILTYLAYGEKVAARAAAESDVRTMPWRSLPGLSPTDPDRPRPTVLHHEDVLAHGLRHLALLARRVGNDRFAERLGRRSRAFFVAIEPEIAGQIGKSSVTP
jgi:hypothetical protein